LMETILGERDTIFSKSEGTFFKRWCRLVILSDSPDQLKRILEGGESLDEFDFEILLDQLAGRSEEEAARMVEGFQWTRLSPGQIIRLFHELHPYRQALAHHVSLEGLTATELLELLDGVFDIYMPDMKYADPVLAQRYSKILDYPAHNQAAVREMHRQVGDLQLDDEGIATRGLLVRHLVLPEGIAGTEAIVRFLAEEISTNTYINVMGQYRPAWRVRERDIAPLNRPVTRQEVEEATAIARRAGLRLDERGSRILRWL